LDHTIHIIPYAFPVFINIFMHIGSPEGITLLEFEAMGEEDQQETQQQEAPEGEEQAPEELPECLDHRPSAFMKGKPRSILSLIRFTNTNLSSLCLIHSPCSLVSFSEAYSTSQ
jgi:hypothetical protein